jgi:hypothetical protein
MERPQDPAICASLFDGVYRPAFIVGTSHSFDCDSEPKAPEPSLSFISPSFSVPEYSSFESASAAPQLGPIATTAFYSSEPKGMVRLRGLMTKQPRRSLITPRASVRIGWKGYAKVDRDYLHPDDKFVDAVPVFGHRTRSGR